MNKLVEHVNSKKISNGMLVVARYLGNNEPKLWEDCGISYTADAPLERDVD